MTDSIENAILGALKDIENGVSQRKAAQRWGIPRSTLQKRLNGSQSRSDAFESLQRLSKEQEYHLVQWILVQTNLGLPPTHQTVKEFATRIIKAGGDDQPLGKHWIEGFLRRNPEVRTVRGKPIDSCRLNGATINVIKGFFQFQDHPDVKDIPGEHRYNMDETGILEGRGSNGLVLGHAEKKAIMKKQPGSRCWTTIIECISATGRILPPLVIFKGLTVQQQWFPDEIEFLASWAFKATEKGWTNDEIALWWLQEIFIPQTQPDPPSKRLLIVDGHGSHCTDDFLYECFKNDIYLLFLPPHTSHVLQPLDISIFSPVKSYYRQALSEYEDCNDTTPAGKRIFLECYHKARTRGLTSQNAKAGWRGSGLWPLNMAKPLLSRLVIPEPPEVTTTPKTVNSAARKKNTVNFIEFDTPQRSQDVRKVINSIKVTSPRTRLLLRKVGKQLDRKNTKK
jgi:DDE superfamily endonuclease/Tc5 transposase DNA-binding domain/helix-turn-helix, Psq domain